MEQWIVKFYLKLGKTANKTYYLFNEMYCNKYSSRALSWAFLSIFKGVEKALKMISTEVTLPRQNRITLSNGLGISAFAETVGIHKEFIWKILHKKFNMQKAWVNMLSKILTLNNKDLGKMCLLTRWMSLKITEM